MATPGWTISDERQNDIAILKEHDTDNEIAEEWRKMREWREAEDAGQMAERKWDDDAWNERIYAT
jgi:hypothetical protein